MNTAILQLLVLAGVALFLILRLKSVLGTREGFEKSQTGQTASGGNGSARRADFEVIEGGPDADITEHFQEGTDAAKALAAMKMAEPDFTVSEFVSGARGAYEWILMAYETGDLSEVRPFLSEDVATSFQDVIDMRADKGLSVEASFVGLRNIELADAKFDGESGEAEITVRYTGELTYTVRDHDGEIVEGDPQEVRRQHDVWTFARRLGVDDPNWQLVATGE